MYNNYFPPPVLKVETLTAAAIQAHLFLCRITDNVSIQSN